LHCAVFLSFIGKFCCWIIIVVIVVDRCFAVVPNFWWWASFEVKVSHVCTCQTFSRLGNGMFLEFKVYWLFCSYFALCIFVQCLWHARMDAWQIYGSDEFWDMDEVIRFLGQDAKGLKGDYRQNWSLWF